MSARSCGLACLVIIAAIASPGWAGPLDAPARPRFTLAAGVAGWRSAMDAWSYEESFLGTARGSGALVRHDGGWDARAAVALGRLAAGSNGLRAELCYGQDRLALSEHLQPVHVGTARRYDLGRLERRRLTARVGSGFRLRGGLSMMASVGLVDVQFNRFTVTADDPELPYAVGGRLDVDASDATLVFNPLEVDLRADFARRLFALAGCAYDRAEAPLAWRISGAPLAAGVRDQLSVAGVSFHLGAGICW